MQRQTKIQTVEAKAMAVLHKWKPAKIVFGLSTIAICAKIFGFIEKIVIAHFFGTSKTSDVYFAVMGIVLSIVFLIKELTYPSVLPVFSRALTQPVEVSGSLFRKVFLTVAAFLAIIIVSLTVFTPFFTNIFVPGFIPSQQETTSNLLRLLVPSIMFLGLMTLTYTVLNAHKRFWVSALGEMGFKVLIVIGLVFFLPTSGIYVIAPIVGFSALGCLCYHLCCLGERKYLLGYRVQNSLSSELFRDTLKLMAPLVVGAVFSHMSALVDNMLASKLPAGQLSYLNYAKKIIDAVLLIGPVALVTVVYVQASQLASMERREEFADLIRKTFRILLYISVPVACLLIELKRPLLEFLFQHGRFDVSSTLGTSEALMVYSFGLVTFSLEALLVHSFYALSDTKTPTKYGIICVVIDIVLAVAMLKQFEHTGIAAAFVISKTIKIIILGNRLAKKVKGLFDADIVRFILKLLSATVTLWIVLRIFAAVVEPGSFIHTAIFRLILPGSVSVLVFAVSSYLLNIEELRKLISMFMNRRKVI